jgi:predicted permease
MLFELLDIVLPIYVSIGLGALWARSGRAYDTALVTDLIMLIGAPCLVFSTLTDLAVDPATMARLALATVAALLVLGVLGGLLLAGVRLPRHTYLGPLVFMNVGNMGLPLCLYAFGDEGLTLGVTFFAVGALAQFTVGIVLWSGRLSVMEVVRTPLAWAAGLAVLVLVTGTPVPEWLRRTTTVLGGVTIPLMQFTLGVSLVGLHLGRLPRAFGLAVARFGLGVTVGIGLATAFGLDGVAWNVFVLDCAMPVAVFNYLLAERYGRSPEDVAGLVVVSTLLSFVTIPALLAWLL